MVKQWNRLESNFPYPTDTVEEIVVKKVWGFGNIMKVVLSWENWSII